MKGILEIRDLIVNLGDFKLGPMSLSLEKGDYLVLLGPSGCGKTTLLNAIAGVCLTEPGMLLLNGQDCARTGPHKRGVGYVFQTPNLFPHMTVADNVRFGLAYMDATAREKKQRFDRVVELVGLGNLLRRYPATLSGGETRRVALARSMVIAPKILLLDEPLSMLDPNASQQMLEMLATIHKQTGTTTIHVTHDRQEPWVIEGRCAVMREGQIEQVGTVEGLSRSPRTRFVATFLTGANTFPATFSREAGTTVADLGWARLPLADAVDYDKGFVHIRPESLAICDDRAGGSLMGSVGGIRDRGSFVVVGLNVSGEVACVAHLPVDRVGGIQVGQSITLRLTKPPHPMRE